MDDYKVKTYNKNCKILIALILFLYGMTMCSKNIFSAELIEIIEVFGVSSAKANLTNTFYYIAYAIMQIIIVAFIDKIDVRKYLIITMAISAIFISMLGIVGNATGNIVALWLIFALNGILQAGCYSICMKISAKYLSKSMLPRVNKLMSSVGIIVNAIAYGIAAIFVSFSRWDLPFLILGIIFLFSVFLFAVLSPMIIRKIVENKIEDEKIIENEKLGTTNIVVISNNKDKIFTYIMLVVLVFLANSLYFAVNTWFSKLLYDVYGVPKFYSIFISLFVPLIIFLGSVIAVNSCEKYKNIYIVAIVMYLVSLVFSLSLVFFYDVNLIFAIFMEVSFLIIVNGARNIYQGITVFKLRTIIDSGKTSLILNASASIAAGVAPTIIAWVFDNFGWSLSFLLLFIIDLILIITTLFFVYVQKQKTKKMKILSKN